MHRLNRLRGFAAPKVNRFIEFLTLQGITMAANLLYGFLCLRILTIPEYAKYIVVFVFMSTLTLLMDVSFSSTLLPLIGHRIDDRKLIADYVASLRQLARWLFLAAIPVVLIVYPLMVRRQDWGWKTVAGMLAILLVAGWFARVSGAYGAVLIVRRDRRMWYGVQMISAFGTLALLIVFWALHGLNVFSAILINVVGIIFVASAYYARARHLLGVGGVSSPRIRREIVHLAAPNIAYAIFYAFQGQIGMFLIAVFGHTHAVASLGALTRLARIYALFGYMGPLLIEPYFAKLGRERLLRNYALAAALVSLFAATVTALAYCLPQVFLWILGPKYANLRLEVVLMLAVAGLGFVYDMLGIINSARKFVYWWNGIATIVLTIVVQIVCILRVDLSSVRGILMFSLATLTTWLVVAVATGVYGFLRGPREYISTHLEADALSSQIISSEGLLEEQGETFQ